MSGRVPATRFLTAAATDPGNTRSENEDAFLASPEKGVWAVADGMGGHHGGQWASRLVVEALDRIDPATSAAELLRRCEESVHAANRSLAQYAETQGHVIGTTLAVLLIFDRNYICLWAGDSRIYLVRDGTLRQLSCDHTEAQELVAQGVLSSEEARTWPRRNVITRAIGIAPEPELESAHGLLQTRDIFLLCSDGLTSHVTDAEILQLLRQSAPQQACESLVALTLDRGGADNVTVVVTRFEEDGTRIALPLSSAPR